MKKIIHLDEQGMLTNHGTILECLCHDHLYEFQYLEWDTDTRILYIKFWGDSYREAKWGRLRWAWQIITRGYEPKSSIELMETDVEPFIDAVRNAFDRDRDN